MGGSSSWEKSVTVRMIPIGLRHGAERHLRTIRPVVHRSTWVQEGRIQFIASVDPKTGPEIIVHQLDEACIMPCSMVG